MLPQRKAKILIIGYHGCLVTHFSKDKAHHFSPAILQRTSQKQYDFFIGLVNIDCKNAAQMHSLTKINYIDVERKSEPKLKLKNIDRIAKHKNEKFNEANLYLDRITANFYARTEINFMAVSSLEDVLCPEPWKRKCGDKYPQLVQAEKDHDYEVDDSEECKEIKRSPEENLRLQLSQIINLAQKELPFFSVEIDFIHVKKNCEHALGFNFKTLPANFILNVFLHQHPEGLSEEIVKIATMTSKKLEKNDSKKSILFSPKPKLVTKFFNLEDGVVPKADTDECYFSLKDKPEDETDSCCSCLPTWCRRS